MDDNGLRSATTARGLCRGRVLRAFVVVQPFDGHSSIGSASITGSTTSRALPSASHPCGLFGGLRWSGIGVPLCILSTLAAG